MLGNLKRDRDLLDERGGGFELMENKGGGSFG